MGRGGEVLEQDSASCASGFIYMQSESDCTTGPGRLYIGINSSCRVVQPGN